MEETDEYPTANAYFNAKIVAALDYMTSSREAVSVSDIARHVHLSPSRSKHLFKLETGTTPKRVLRRLQVERASEMLRASREQVKWIAAEAGMPVLATFERNFSAISGTTPGEYRRRVRAAVFAGVAEKEKDAICV
jgi:transcriptional regulator GlxA family with amidase domain